MILGVLTCSKKKLNVPAPAWLMYSVSPRFSQQYQALCKKCDRVLILSAKYGPVAPEEVLQPYDVFLGEPSESWIATCQAAILEIKPSTIVSYLSSNYTYALPDSIHVEQLEGGVYARATSVGVQGKLKRGEKVVCWPMLWVLEFVNQKPCTVQELANEVKARGYTDVTVKAQVQRALICPLHQVREGKLENKYG